MNLVAHDDPLLHSVIPEYTGEPRDLEFYARGLHKLMLDTEGKSRAVGIAAPQVGLNVRMFLINTRQSKWWQDVTVCINPELIEARGPLESYNEGCLSHPAKWPKSRQVDISVAYTNLAGERVRRDFTGITARMFQHELDHLNGIVIWPVGSAVEPDPFDGIPLYP